MIALKVLPATVLALLALAAPAAACSIAVPADYDPVQDPYDAAKLAFTGKVTKVRSLDPPPAPGAARPSGERYEATIRVRRVYKGDVARTIRVRGSTDQGTCGYGRLRVGERLGLYVFRGSRSPYAIATGSGVSYRDLEKASGGRSRAPRG